MTVFNIGPTGNLNLLYPDDPTAGMASIEANRPLQVIDAEVTPPGQRERVFALWIQESLPLRHDRLHGIAEHGRGTAWRPYQSTRDMKRVQSSIAALPGKAWHTAIVEVEQIPG